MLRPVTSFDELERDGGLDGFEWEYVAAGEACELGKALHGRRFGSLAELYELLPQFGPNPGCTGVCTCTALPQPIPARV